MRCSGPCKPRSAGPKPDAVSVDDASSACSCWAAAARVPGGVQICVPVLCLLWDPGASRACRACSYMHAQCVSCGGQPTLVPSHSHSDTLLACMLFLHGRRTSQYRHVFYSPCGAWDHELTCNAYLVVQALSDSGHVPTCSHATAACCKSDGLAWIRLSCCVAPPGPQARLTTSRLCI
jgi:hypothetical protein